jgi:hypothetical protein
MVQIEHHVTFCYSNIWSTTWQVHPVLGVFWRASPVFRSYQLWPNAFAGQGHVVTLAENTSSQHFNAACRLFTWDDQMSRVRVNIECPIAYRYI